MERKHSVYIYTHIYIYTYDGDLLYGKSRKVIYRDNMWVTKHEICTKTKQEIMGIYNNTCYSKILYIYMYIYTNTYVYYG